MNEKQYEVYENENRIASNMSLETALLLIRGYCERYYNERARLTLVEMERKRGNHDEEQGQKNYLKI